MPRSMGLNQPNAPRNDSALMSAHQWEVLGTKISHSSKKKSNHHCCSRGDGCSESEGKHL